jgi:hypothetical protein
MSPFALPPMLQTNHGDEVMLQHRFWTNTVNSYVAAGVPDPDYLLKLLDKAAYWQEQRDAYMAHLCATNTSHHLSF